MKKKQPKSIESMSIETAMKIGYRSSCTHANSRGDFGPMYSGYSRNRVRKEPKGDKNGQ